MRSALDVSPEATLTMGHVGVCVVRFECAEDVSVGSRNRSGAERGSRAGGGGGDDPILLGPIFRVTRWLVACLVVRLPFFAFFPVSFSSLPLSGVSQQVPHGGFIPTRAGG